MAIGWCYVKGSGAIELLMVDMKGGLYTTMHFERVVSASDVEITLRIEDVYFQNHQSRVGNIILWICLEPIQEASNLI
jgi:hypothetical protein